MLPTMLPPQLLPLSRLSRSRPPLLLLLPLLPTTMLPPQLSTLPQLLLSTRLVTRSTTRSTTSPRSLSRSTPPPTPPTTSSTMPPLSVLSSELSLKPLLLRRPELITIQPRLQSEEIFAVNYLLLIKVTFVCVNVDQIYSLP